MRVILVAPVDVKKKAWLLRSVPGPGRAVASSVSSRCVHSEADISECTIPLRTAAKTEKFHGARPARPSLVFHIVRENAAAGGGGGRARSARGCALQAPRERREAPQALSRGTRPIKCPREIMILAHFRFEG